jgi:hypothetical protein
MAPTDSTMASTVTWMSATTATTTIIITQLHRAELPKAGILDTEEHFPKPSRLRNNLKDYLIVLWYAVIYQTMFL